jgi:hypothetical protein
LKTKVSLCLYGTFAQWNTNDEYWTPERRFYRDLPIGMPMAQAAVQFGYNGGLDMFGRKITLGNGIDIADGAFLDGLGMRHNDLGTRDVFVDGARPLARKGKSMHR